GVALAEIPSLRTVGRFRRRTVAGLAAAMTIAQAYPGRIARTLVAAPAGEPPVERAAGPVHDSSSFTIAPYVACRGPPAKRASCDSFRQMLRCNIACAAS